MDAVLDRHRLQALVRLLHVDLHCVDLDLPNRLELEDLLEVCVELVELGTRILQQELVEVLLADVLVAFLDHLIVILLDLLQNMHVMLACLGAPRVPAWPLLCVLEGIAVLLIQVGAAR